MKIIVIHGLGFYLFELFRFYIEGIFAERRRFPKFDGPFNYDVGTEPIVWAECEIEIQIDMDEHISIVVGVS